MVKEQQRTAGLASARVGSAAEARLAGIVAGRSCSHQRRRGQRRDLGAGGGSIGDAAADRARSFSTNTSLVQFRSKKCRTVLGPELVQDETRRASL
jgi:hypothetical protein